MTPNQSDTLIRQLFHWITSPIDSPEQRQMAVSKVAVIVCDTCSEWLTLAEPLPADNRQLAEDCLLLHESYARIKPEYVKVKP